MAAHQVVERPADAQRHVRVMRDDDAGLLRPDAFERLLDTGLSRYEIVDADERKPVKPHRFVMQHRNAPPPESLEQNRNKVLEAIIMVAQHGKHRDAYARNFLQVGVHLRHMPYALGVITREEYVIGAFLLNDSAESLRGDSQPFDVKIADLKNTLIKAKRVSHSFDFDPLRRKYEEEVRRKKKQ